MRLGRNHILIGLAVVIGIYLAISGIYNYLLSEEQKIKNIFYEMAGDIEEKSVLDFGDYFTKDARIHYLDQPIKAEHIGPFLWRLVQNYKEIDVTFSELSVELDGDRAVVTFAGDAIDSKRRTGGSFEGTAKLRKVEGEWKVYDATGRQHRRPKTVF